MRKKAVTPTSWSQHDVAILHTRDILDRSLNGTLDARPPSAVTFRTAFGGTEQMLVSGGFQRCTFRAVGDGSYSHSSGMFLATGRGAVAATALFAGAQALGNSSRRAAARADAMELLAPRTVHLQGQSTEGSVSWLFRSDWAELLLGLWALHEHPSHPQLDRWIPPGWEERHAEMVLTGSMRPTPSVRSRLTRQKGTQA